MKYFVFAVFCALAAIASGHRLNRRFKQQQQQQVHTTMETKTENKYEYKYGVKDIDSGDIKQQWEFRDGDKVKGGYAFKEADGLIRVVEYFVDGQSGFNAIVRRIDPSKFPSNQKHSASEHITFNGHHVQHDREGRAKSYMNNVTY